MSETVIQDKPIEQREKQQQPKKKFEGPKRDAIVDLGKYKDTEVRVELMGGRLVTGILKGYDSLMNLVIDNAIEYVKGLDDQVDVGKEEKRELGLTVVRGTVLSSISPVDGSNVIYISMEE
ncbi:hypothetical protein TPHA_0I01310 [Tetrapisispora phaffii CBS 4417]|uniref:Sm domain-containing protein n=1 Tax=Tetrapisispora phaffii (strain ATCC 24235 / CBS 4417 / NBRC 1672 / NRRL Y-8282 / UCD 70-5) TaxID=1071381 RepID=G8BXL0_TETPH|nr:hypothetical protein TPHA_0I01310 [Tetrapisispora phaffii CBS 4417]CCE64638.1 hypothetical protein TPHA_0I01310 [Tetrapisispora phaffii CBS 4417]